MPHRYDSEDSSVFGRVRLFAAVREVAQRGYSRSDFRADLVSGLVVCLVAVPLGMALAIASGVAPQYGLYTVIVGGATVALFGGSRFQVTGPTAAFVVILLPIVNKFGFGGLLLAGFLAGVMLILMGLAHMGRLIQYIPHPVTTGFTSGIALVIAILQLKDFLGLNVLTWPERFPEKVAAIFKSLPSAAPWELGVGAFTVLILLVWPKINKKIPGPLVSLGTVSALVFVLQHLWPEISVATIGTRFGNIPQVLPHFAWPWEYVGQDGLKFQLSLENVEALIPSAFAIAMLGAIESLLSAVIADGMTRTKHNPDAELVALGIGNLLCPFFGGIAATGAIARTATNIRFGAKSPWSAILHAVFTLLVIVLFAPLVSYLPMAALAGLLMVIAYNMSEAKHFAHILRVAPRSDVIVLLICFSLTVAFDMVVGVTVGVMLAAILFMRRMAEVSGGHSIASPSAVQMPESSWPKNVILYEIEGPLFFGAAGKAASALVGINEEVRGIVFLMQNVPTMDFTGLVALESAVKKIVNQQRTILLVGLRPQPAGLLQKSGLISAENHVLSVPNLTSALKYFNSN